MHLFTLMCRYDLTNYNTVAPVGLRKTTWKYDAV